MNEILSLFLQDYGEEIPAFAQFCIGSYDMSTGICSQLTIFFVTYICLYVPSENRFCPLKFLKLEKDLFYSQNARSNEQGVFDQPIGSPVVCFFRAGELLASGLFGPF